MVRHPEKTKALQSQQRSGTGNSRYIHEINNQEIVDLYKQGYGAPKISKILGIPQSTVENRLRASQVVMRPVGHQYWSEEEKKVVGARMKIRHAGSKNPAYRHDISTEQLITLYSQGHSLAEIGKRIIHLSRNSWETAQESRNSLEEQCPISYS